MRTEFTMAPPETVHGNLRVRNTLLEFFIDCCSTSELSRWLTSLGQSTLGSSQEKRSRLRRATTFLSMESARLPRTVLSFLLNYGDEQLNALCESLQLAAEGPPDVKVRRVLRHIGHMERWLPMKFKLSERPLTLAHIRPFLDFHLVAKAGKEDQEFMAPLATELQEIFGPDEVGVRRVRVAGRRDLVKIRVGREPAPAVRIQLERPQSVTDLDESLARARSLQAAYPERCCLVVFTDRMDLASREHADRTLAREPLVALMK